jgi:GNAT superfamily N-acetyltransferase
VIVRDARPGDRDAILAVTLAAYQEYAERMPVHWEAYRRDILTTLTHTGSAEQIVAEEDEMLVGAVLLYPAGTAGGALESTPSWGAWPEVRLLAVAPSARGRGIGATLMQECVRRARRAGATALTLHTTDMMAAAVRLYRRMGFVRAPDLDFRPVPEVTINGYRLDIGGRSGQKESP